MREIPQVQIHLDELLTQQVLDEHPLTDVYRDNLKIKTEGWSPETYPISELVLEKFKDSAAIISRAISRDWNGSWEEIEIQWWGSTPTEEIIEYFRELFADLAPEVSVGFRYEKKFDPHLQYSTWEAKARLESRKGGFGSDPFSAFRRR